MMGAAYLSGTFIHIYQTTCSYILAWHSCYLVVTFLAMWMRGVAGKIPCL